MKTRNPLSGVLLATLSLVGITQAVPSLAGGNGGFETNSFANPGFAAINGLWETTAGSADGWTFNGTGRWFMQTDNGGNSFGAPQDGDYYVNLSLGATGYAFSMSTAITGLAIGTNYAVEFYASERSGIAAGTSFSASVDTDTPSTLTVTEASLPAITSGSSNYVKQTLSFTATAESHTLTISNAGTGAGGNGFLVDNFTVVEEPWTPADGVWTGGDGNWNTASNWQADAIAQGIDKSAIFNSVSPVTATVDVNRPIGALLFSGADHTLAAGAGGLTLDGDTLFATPTITVSSGITATIDATLNGTEGLLKDGGGTLVLSGVNPYTGPTSVAGGTLTLELAGRTGNAPIGIFDVASGATLNLDNTNTTLGGANELYPASFLLSGSGTLAKTNIGSIDFWDGSDLTGFTGTVDVQEGALRVNNIGTAASMDSATLNIASGATFDVRYNVSLSVDKLTGEGTLDQTFDGGSGLSVTVGTNDGSSTFDGVIQNGSGQPLALAKSGAGTFTLAGANTYTGNTTVNDGTLNVPPSGSLRFVPTGAATNAVSGTATATLSFLGTIDLDLNAADLTDGNAWTLFDLDTFIGPAPTLAPAAITSTAGPFVQSGTTWTLADGSNTWTFEESTGVLSLAVVSGSDFDTWGSTYGLSTGSEGGDLDNDGVTNFEEYAFGLIPNSGSSVNAFAVPFDKATGTFSYTRRTQSLTGLTYTVWYSTDLSGWTQDTGAVEGTPAVSGDVETVPVTISGSLLTNPKLFVQVRAQ